MNRLRTCPCTAKYFGLPCVIAIIFILFTMLYSPDAYKRSVSILPFAIHGPTYLQNDQNMSDKMNEIAQQTFPLDVLDWIHICNGISHLVVLEPESLKCIGRISNQSCLISRVSSVYRFALIDSGQLDANSGVYKIIQASFALGWKRLINKNKPGAIVFKKYKVQLIVSVLDLRPNYWYLYGTQPNSAIQEPPRAFLGLNTTGFAYTTQADPQILIPTPLEFYLWQWPRSRFLECNRTSAQYLRRKYPENYNETPTINDAFVEALVYARDVLLRHGLTVMLAGGTGLGWYRECGFIPYTTDVDIMFPASEWDPAVEQDLKQDRILKLYWILGKPSDSFELSVYSRSIKIDIFAMYEEKNQSWIGGMFVPKKQKLKWFYPKYEQACTADLKGQLFYVRCDIVAFLTADYGPTWYEPHHDKNFVWYSSHRNVQKAGTWSSAEWRSVYRTF